ncbi:MAG: GatB/YqeY domain-containing protein [Clostridiales bacterium]|jgi:uncharacterized protein YqeY|nr:GatB/YqeY domain-containing protein [Clostridiales bacterium]
MTLQELKKEKIEAMKARDKEAVTALNVIINKLMLIEKSGKGEVTELDVTSAIQKTQKELLEERDAFEKAGRDDTVETLNKQIASIEKYLPKLLTAEEIDKIIKGLDDKSIPTVMRYFSANYAGKVDMKMVNEILRKQ